MPKDTKQESGKEFNTLTQGPTIFARDFGQIIQAAINESIEKNSKKNPYGKLSKKNILIIGGVSSGKTSILEIIKDILPHKIIDVGKLFRVISYFVINDTEKNAIRPNINKLKENGIAEIDRVGRALTSKIYLLKNLFGEIEIVPENNRNSIYAGSINIDRKLYSIPVDTLVSVVAKSYKVRKLVWEWINQYIKNNPGNILTGHSLKDTDTTKYQIINVRIDEKEAAIRLLNNDLGNYDSLDDAINSIKRRNSNDKIKETEKIIDDIHNAIIIDTTNLTLEEVKDELLNKLIYISRKEAEKKKEQKIYGINRQKFEWQINPLIETIRILGKDIFADTAKKYQNEGVSEFDLTIQTIIHLVGKQVEDIWHGYENIYKDNHSPEVMLSYLKNAKTEKENLYNGIKNKKIALNKDLVQTEAENQAIRLMELFKNTKTEYDGKTIKLPARLMGNPHANPFGKENINTTLTSNYGKMEKAGDSEFNQFIVKEKISGKKVIIKRVAKEISKLYSEGFHYLHSYRKDEIASFGAYLEGDTLPFAWVSYSPIDRDYKKEMLQFLGIENHRILEMTRAWNSVWSPKNTMSTLFNFANKELAREWNEKVKTGEADKPLAGIITSINGNLGFHGSAFKGIGFKVVGLKPAHFTYLVSKNNSIAYMPRRSIFEELKLENISELDNHPRCASNKFPLLPTNEMTLLFDEKEDKKLDKKSIYFIMENSYKNIKNG